MLMSNTHSGKTMLPQEKNLSTSSISSQYHDQASDPSKVGGAVQKGMGSPLREIEKV